MVEEMKQSRFTQRNSAKVDDEMQRIIETRKIVIKITKQYRATFCLPDSCQMRFTTCLWAGDVERTELAHPIRPAINPLGGNAVTVTDDEITMLLSAADLQIKGKLLHWLASL
jgi:hypothetical protein